MYLDYYFPDKNLRELRRGGGRRSGSSRSRSYRNYTYGVGGGRAGGHSEGTIAGAIFGVTITFGLIVYWIVEEVKKCKNKKKEKPVVKNQITPSLTFRRKRDSESSD